MSISATRLPEDRHCLAAGNLEVETFEHTNDPRGCGKLLGDTDGANDPISLRYGLSFPVSRSRLIGSGGETTPLPESRTGTRYSITVSATIE